jgi:4-hydroxybenzoate polyprenyltransferase
LIIASLLAVLLPPSFQWMLAGYYLLTTVYSFVIKKLLLADVIALASLYTLRIIAGAMAVMVPLSFWMLLFSVFLFLSLALIKRFAELDTVHRLRRSGLVGRAYRIEDLPFLESLGISSGYMSVLVLALYIHSPEIEDLYSRPKIIWILCILLLYWITRAWMVTRRGKMHSDPVLFALKDPTSLAIGMLCALSVLLAI